MRRREKMSIKAGDAFPKVKLQSATDQAIADIDTAEFFKGKRVVLFGLPGAFTPVCSATHLPSYVSNYQKLRDKGVDSIACLSVNDAYVMQAWGKQFELDGKVELFADGNGALTKALGLELDGSAVGLGSRCQRFVMSVNDGVVEWVDIEESPAACDLSHSDKVLAKL